MKTPRSYKFAKFFLKGKAWAWYLDWLIRQATRPTPVNLAKVDAYTQKIANAPAIEIDRLERNGIDLGSFQGGPRVVGTRLTDAQRKSAQSTIRSAMKKQGGAVLSAPTTFQRLVLPPAGEGPCPPVSGPHEPSCMCGACMLA